MGMSWNNEPFFVVAEYLGFVCLVRITYTCTEKLSHIVNDAGIAFNRFRNDPAFQRGFEAGGRLLVQGSLVLGRYGGSVSEAPYDPESEIETALNLPANSFDAGIYR